MTFPSIFYWFSGTVWVSGFVFALALMSFVKEVKEEMDSESKKIWGIVLSTALLVGALLAWWATAVQEYQQSARFEVVNIVKQTMTDGVIVITFTGEIVSPFIPKWVDLTIKGSFVEDIEIDSLNTGMVQTFRAKNNSASFQGIRIINPTGKYNLIIKTTQPDNIKLEAHFP